MWNKVKDQEYLNFHILTWMSHSENIYVENRVHIFFQTFQTVEKLNGQIADLDEKASSLDKRRTQTIASISYINERNRKNNVEKAERAIMVSVDFDLYLMVYVLLLCNAF